MSKSLARAAVATRLQRTLLSKAKPALKAVKPLEVWRDFVNRRWNAQAQFLNLEVRPLGPFIWAA